MRFMLIRSSLVECVSVLPGNRCLQNVEFFFLRQYVQPCLLKNSKYTFYTIKSSLKLAYKMKHNSLLNGSKVTKCVIRSSKSYDTQYNGQTKKGTTCYLGNHDRIHSPCNIISTERCILYWNVATVIHRLLFSVEIQCHY